MTQRASESLVAVLIRIGLLLTLAILLMAENAQAQRIAANAHAFTSPGMVDSYRPGQVAWGGASASIAVR